MKYFMRLCYDGTSYHGWQRQPRHVSVQGMIEDCLYQVTQEKISIVGCGRTDAGVHASNYTAHFIWSEYEYLNLMEQINHLLPKDIRVLALFPVHSRAHAQKDPISRTYTYRIQRTREKSNLYNISNYLLPGLDFPLLSTVTEQLVGTHDFRSFCKQPDLYRHTRCTVVEAVWTEQSDKKRLVFSITADRYLRRMIRLLVPQLLGVAVGKMSLSDFNTYLLQQQPLKYPSLAHPKGLSLSGVAYPYPTIE